MRKLVSAVAALFLIATGQATAAADLKVSGRVPSACVAQLSSGGNGGTILAAYCNGQSGYSLALLHAPVTSDATFHWGGRSVPVSPSGVTILQTSAGPGYANAQLTIDGPESVQHRIESTLTVEIAAL